ncbi:hypothetical protein BHE74_00016115 [Ensete ventricosum]|nr:hypothetical protein GW17_00014718 [Ensete ventricosum]RWW75835.1 hypothetical protein BHE74_00016115 [Ensete ventricosum]
MAAALLNTPLSISTQNPKKTLGVPLQDFPLLNPRLSRFDRRKLLSSPSSSSSLILSKRNGVLDRLQSVSGGHVSAIPVETKNYEFSDGDAEESRDIYVLPNFNDFPCCSSVTSLVSLFGSHVAAICT